MRYRVTLIEHEDGVSVSCPALRGCHSQGKTRLNRRSQKRSYTWKTLHRLWQRFAVPPPKIVEVGRKPLKETFQLVWQLGPALAVNLYGQHYQRARA